MPNSTSPAPSESNVDQASAGKLKLELADRLELGARLRRCREATGKTTLEIAEEILGYSGSHAAVSRLERGVFAVVNLDHLHKLAEFYGTTTVDLLQGTGDVASTDLPEISGTWKEADIRPGLPGRLRDLRQALGLTRKQMALRLGHRDGYQQQIAGWESGTITPVPDTLLQVATTFGVSGSWLILGARGKARAPTQSMRVRALRHLKGLSRPQLAMVADPQDFRGMRSSIANAETAGRPLPLDRLDSLAKALDVPVSFLDPQALRYAPPGPSGEQPPTGLLNIEVPAMVRKLVEQIVTMYSTDLIDGDDIADVYKQLSRKAWARTNKAAA